ncbi:restriction endonuclease subunit S [Mammaliicoccus lentus]|uniref:restriction endonuclease subunit S n=1 Tax=Mammaliicoccus lentus TaxID=42858 RepID=UPI001C4F7D9C|nr:restriction endonuclease subunit S [Mammaliicoccus lentus]MBW0762233.1 restriction endonuclease subunit S [Mammaliicoccus lentus]
MINKLEDIAQFISGKAFTSKDFTENPQVEGALPIIRIQNVNSEEAQFKYWNKDYDEKFIVTSGDLLMSLSGDFKLKIWDGPKALLNQRVVKIEINDNVNKYYLFKYLQSKIYILTSMGNSSIINNLSIKTLKKFNIELPNLINQNKIENIIRKLDVQLSKRKEQLKLLDELEESLFNNMFEQEMKNTENLLSEIILDTKYGSSTKADFTKESKMPIIRIPNILNSRINHNDLKYVEMDQKERDKYKLMKNDILIVRSNGNPQYVGRSAIVTENEKDFVFASYLVRITLDNKLVNSTFINFYLNSKYGRREILKKARTSAGQYNINNDGIKNINCFIPELNKQNRFAKKIEEIEELKKQCQKSLKYYEELYKTLLYKAFNGELFKE